MEGNIFDVVRVLSLVVTWGIPAILVLAVVVFVLAAPILGLAGVVLRLYDAVRSKLLRKIQGEAQPLADERTVQETRTAETPALHTAEKELVGTRS